MATPEQHPLKPATIARIARGVRRYLGTMPAFVVVDGVRCEVVAIEVRS
jgi:hypothetical protein